MKEEKKYFNSLDHDVKNINVSNEFEEKLPLEAMMENADTLSASSTTRRDFLKFLGFSSVAATLASCEAPVVKSIPYLNKPEEITPGNPVYYASSYFSENVFASILVKNREGRPILLSSNENPAYGGGVNARCQASVLSLYDSNRLKNPLKNKDVYSWDDIDKEVINKIKNSSNKIVLLTPTIISPSTELLLTSFQNKYDHFKVVTLDTVSQDAMLTANKKSFGRRFVPTYRFDKADVIVSFDADFLSEWLDPSHARQYTANRKPENGKMSRHYHFESLLSVTGANADKRVPIKPSEQEQYTLRLYDAVLTLANQSSINSTKTKHDKLINGIAKELWSKKGKSLVVSGSDNVNIQLITNAINQLLGNYENTISTKIKSNLYSSTNQDIHELIAEMNDGNVDMIMFLNTNPAYHLSNSEVFINALKQVETKISFSDSLDETAILCDYVCPNTHYLESWSDFNPYTNFYTLQQPTISPLFNSRQFQDTFLIWMENSTKYYDFLQEFFKKQVSNNWNKVLHDGFVYTTSRLKPENYNLNEPIEHRLAKSSNIELQLYLKSSIGIGVFSNNPWLQELPDPISKVTWDNYLTISPSYAKELGLKNWHVSNGALDGDMVVISVNKKELRCPVYIQPGQAHGVLGLAFGYGRTIVGKSGEGVGVNAFSLYEDFNKFQKNKITIKKIEGTHEFACTQNSHTMMGRNIVKETNFSDYLKNPKAGNKQFLLHSHKGHVKPSELTLWKEHEKDVHFWNMSIDLNSCTGCGACVIACHAENNVPVVGKEEVRKNRDMHWLRIDRYYSSDMTKDRAKEEEVGAIEMYKKMEEPSSSENLEVVFQPVMCQHCNHAPCETVCPVAATTHSREGLNHMTYNRCIGTRYCMNNCPYKVRRFNWFNYADNNQFDYNMNDDLGKMVLNPDVTVRSRGVMEKCTMCIQNIQKSKLDAKKERRKIKDGEIACACEKACDTGAITFGDALDQDSRVSKEKKNPRSYYLIEELNTQPSVFYKTKVRNKKV
ncbi:MAG: quinol:cytochrome C oxidoreductase [Flavobacteriales bacterium]|nr:quinol:cytochrome C oxidoreductase [Flavobacteriales bacterium]|tara:strand:- start:876 stop:3896 length:3021 start_codon:yes stop_codon:yes gene_type:complete